jgi:hypothetical protein
MSFIMASHKARPLQQAELADLMRTMRTRQLLLLQTPDQTHSWKESIGEDV